LPVRIPTMFPVIHSTLDPEALAADTADRFGLPTPVSCRLVSRGNNDIYQVAAGRHRYALRVSKANFRPPEAYDFEAAYTTHLKDHGFLVPAPETTTDGRCHYTLDAPEGPRTTMLLAWLDGTPLSKEMSAEDAQAAGRLLGRIHATGDDFSPPSARPVAAAQMIGQRLPYLTALLDTAPDDQAFAERAAARLTEQLEAVTPSLSSGAVHGDAQYENIMRLKTGGLALMDFDTCGTGVLAEDLFTFVWRADIEGLAPDLNSAFVAGYEQERPLTQAERDALPLLRAARSLAMAATYAWLINRVGPIAGFDHGIDAFLALAKRDSEPLL